MIELENTIHYLEENWSGKEIKKLFQSMENTLLLISKNPFVYQASDIKKDIRRAVILKYNTLYYRVNGNQVEIISFFSNRQNPHKRKAK